MRHRGLMARSRVGLEASHQESDLVYKFAINSPLTRNVIAHRGYIKLPLPETGPSVYSPGSGAASTPPVVLVFTSQLCIAQRMPN